MITSLGLSRLGASGVSSETRRRGRHQASPIWTTPPGCALTSRALQPVFTTARSSRKHTRQVITAVAAVEQEPFQPAKAAKPTAEQIFDLHHVRQVSPSLLLYFPFGTSAADLTKR